MKYLQQFVTTSLNVGGGIDASQTTGIVLQSLNNIDETKPSVACLSWADPLSTSVAEWVTYTSINSTTNELQGVTRGAEGYSAKEHLNQAVVAFPLSKSHVNDLNDILTSTTGAITATLDEDDMASNSATALATQQSIKSYTDNYGNFTSLARQAIINGNFDVWQRGTSFTNIASGTYTTDRFSCLIANSGTLPTSLVHARTLQTPGDLLGSKYYYRITTNGAGSGFGVSDYYTLYQAIENGTSKLCGNEKTVTVSFYARSSIANKKLGVSLQQSYGTGGSPSSVEQDGGATITLSTTWTKYTKTFTTTTLAGKTFGTDNNDSLNLFFFHMWGTTTGTTFGLTGSETFVGAGDIDIAQVQLNAGSVALPFQPKSFEEELRACQRYCYAITTTTNNGAVGFGFANQTTSARIQAFTPTVMRIVPTLTATAGDWQIGDGVSSSIDATSIALTSKCERQMIELEIGCTGATQFRSYVLFGDGTPGRSLILSSEL